MISVQPPPDYSEMEALRQAKRKFAIDTAHIAARCGRKRAREAGTGGSTHITCRYAAMARLGDVDAMFDTEVLLQDTAFAIHPLFNDT